MWNKIKYYLYRYIYLKSILFKILVFIYLLIIIGENIFILKK